MNEEWKEIIGYEGRYEISNTGKVKTLLRKNPGSILRPTTTNDGYEIVSLTDSSGKCKSKTIHRMVIIHFNPVKNYSKLMVNHKDGNKLNNHLHNLEWVNNRENLTHSLNKKGKSSKYIGVYYNKANRNWNARITHKRKCVWLGSFNCETSAYIKYLQALKQYNLINKYA